MSSTIKSKENGTVVIVSVADKEAWKQAQQKGFEKAKSKLKLDGFRDGSKIPDALAKSHISEGDVLNEGINVIIESMFEEALKENNVIPFLQPDVKITKVSNEELEIEFDIPVAPDVKLGEYKGHKVPLKKVEVNEEEIKAEIDKLLSQNSNLKSVERGAKLGDTVVLDFAGFIDGKAFDGGTAKEYSLELGSNSFVPGFEEGLVGVKAGEKKDVVVTFPEQYVKELAGKVATFKCDIKEVKEKETPELNDEFVKSLGIKEVSTVDELKANKKTTLLKNKENSAKNEQFQAIVKEIVGGCEISVSPKMVEKEAEAMKENMLKQIQQNGLTFEQYLEITKSDEKKIMEDLKKQAEENIKTVSVLNKIGEIEKIDVTEEEVNAEMENIAKMYGVDLKMVQEQLGADRIKEDLRHKKIESFVRENNNIDTKTEDKK